MSLEAGNRRKSLVIAAVVAGNFLIGKNVKWRKIVYALNPNFKLFSLKDMMYLSRWYWIYRTLTSWNCLQIFTLVSIVFLYETTRWIPKNILKLLIKSSFNWSTLTAVQTSTIILCMAAPEKRLKQGSLYGFNSLKTREIGWKQWNRPLE